MRARRGAHGTHIHRYEPGQAITISIVETVPHPSYFRIAFHAHRIRVSSPRCARQAVISFDVDPPRLEDVMNHQHR